MKVEQLWVYPIKSLRGCALPCAKLTPQGIPFDRRFMLLRDHKDAANPPTGTRFQNMHVSKFPMMCLFTTELTPPSTEEPESGLITVTHRNPQDDSRQTLEISLFPSSVDLDGEFDVDMHSSPVRGVKMAQEYCDWFSERFGFSVVCVFIGPSLRPVLGNIAPNAAVKNPERRKAQLNADGTSASWLRTLAHAFDTHDAGAADDYKISFADCSSYLVVSAESGHRVSEMLPADEPMDITKFRPNIVVSGAPAAWDEDYWGQITIRANNQHHERGDDSEDEGGAKLELTSNCLRCTSLNVDYATGEFGSGAAGEVLKKLQKDRRIDAGHKYSPAFGRYGFMLLGSPSVMVSVGDQVDVTRRNTDNTTFKWPGIGTTKKEDIWAL